MDNVNIRNKMQNNFHPILTKNLWTLKIVNKKENYTTRFSNIPLTPAFSTLF